MPSVKLIFNFNCLFSVLFYLAIESHSKYECREMEREFVTITVHKHTKKQLPVDLCFLQTMMFNT